MPDDNILAADKLKQRLIRHIRDNGPISVADYMAFCLADHDGGYYMTREPFGKKGDFITAPEVSQMFGELIGVWVVSTWQALGSPENCLICEIGAGRGTLMSDLLRAATKLAPELVRHAQIAMVETSARLTAVQQKKLAGAANNITWHNNFETVPNAPTILVANELLDALPDHQFIKSQGRFIERMVTLSDMPEPHLCFTTGAIGNTTDIDPLLLPSGHEDAPEGSIFETSPARSALTQQICERIRHNTGAALLIDYGSHQAGFGDTLQALYQHNYQDVFAAPGQADITTHVDFAALRKIAESLGCAVKSQEQGDFLISMGLLSRAGLLGAGKSTATQEQIRDDVERLAAPDQMGSLFKTLCITYPEFKISA